MTGLVLSWAKVIHIVNNPEGNDLKAVIFVKSEKLKVKSEGAFTFTF